ncbi:PH domain-containing protein [Verrucosispora sp. ts21]|uniref:PH domain-containing protein n=1 Tax=Verrucosispora sp. ts21 TaxID=2069341 RepID=UPI001304D139|nr:PH domain-containing protein [Verrucosispora sp. ts21]
MHQIWRVSLLGRSATLAVIPLAGILSWLIGSNVFVAGLVVVGGVFTAIRFAFHPAVILTDNDVTVRNPSGSRRVPLDEVVMVEPGYGGLTITTASGDPVVAWAVQKSNLAKWKGWHTRADDVAATIMSASRSGAAAR